MRIAGFEFSPGVWPTLAAAVMIALTLSLGNWQLNRAHEKRDLQQRYDALASEPAVSLPGEPVKSEQYQFRRVEVSGTFDAAQRIYLDNKINKGRPGYHVIEPLRITRSDLYVLVDRGWVAAGLNRSVLPEVGALPGTVKIQGIASIPTKKILELSGDTVQGRVWQNLVMEKYARTLPYRIQPIVILQLNDTADGLVREWERPDSGISTHLGYAFQWFAMASVILVIYVGINAKRETD